MKKTLITTILIFASVFLVINAFTESEVEMQLTRYEGSLKMIGEDWFLVTGGDFYKLILAPEDYLAENKIILENKAQFICDGLLEIEEIFVYTIYQGDETISLRNESGDQLWVENETPDKTYYEVDPDKCIACRLCVKFCPVNAIDMQNGVAVLDIEKCIACGICANGNNNNFKGCPVQAISKVN